MGKFQKKKLKKIIKFTNFDPIFEQYLDKIINSYPDDHTFKALMVLKNKHGHWGYTT